MVLQGEGLSNVVGTKSREEEIVSVERPSRRCGWLELGLVRPGQRKCHPQLMHLWLTLAPDMHLIEAHVK